MLSRKDLAAYRRFRRWHERKYGAGAILATMMGVQPMPNVAKDEAA